MRQQTLCLLQCNSQMSHATLSPTMQQSNQPKDTFSPSMLLPVTQREPNKLKDTLSPTMQQSNKLTDTLSPTV